MIRWLASFARDTRGVAAAEMAMVTPLLMVIMFGIFEAGNFFWNEHIVVKAVRDGARFAGRQSYLAFSCPSGGGAGSFDTTRFPNLPAQIKNVTRTGQLTGGTARVSGWIDSQVVLTVDCINDPDLLGIYTSNAGNAPRVKVVATVPYPSLFGALGFNTSGLSVSASAQSPVMGI